MWSIDQWSGTDTSGTNGSGAIVQSATGTGATTAASISLAAITAGNSVTGAFANSAANGATVDTVGAGFTKLGESGHTISVDADGHLMSEWKLGAQTTVNATIGDLAGSWGGIAIEILAGASAFAAAVTNPLLGRQFMKANPRFNTAIPSVVVNAFRRTLHPFGAGKGKRTRNR